MAKIVLMVTILISSMLVACDDGLNCNTNLLRSRCPAESIIQPCNSWYCTNVSNSDDEIILNDRRFDCKVIDCDLLSCIDLQTDEVIDFTNIQPTGEIFFSTLLNSDMDMEFNCGLLVQ